MINQTATLRRTEVAYRAISNDGTLAFGDSLPDAVFAISTMCHVDSAQCVTAQISEDDWLVYSDHDRLDADGDGGLAFARITIEQWVS